MSKRTFEGTKARRPFIAAIGNIDVRTFDDLRQLGEVE
jgi:hypothetical protein